MKITFPEILIYTDGACSPNPGPGGWGAVLLRQDGLEPLELSGGEEKTTNNRMELTAAIEALLSLSEPHHIEIFTDSKYLKKGITEWLPLWKKRNWQTMEGTSVKNQDLWKILADRIRSHKIKWKWLKGHAHNKWNERADVLARGAVQRKSLPLDDDEAIHIFASVSYKMKTKTGGWCVILRFRGNIKVLNGAVPNTSGNRMHLQAAIEGLAAIKRPLPINLYTYSAYLKDGITKWVKQWSTRGWQTKDGNPVRHRDLWIKLHNLAQRYQVQWYVANKNEPPCEMQEAKLLAGEVLSE